MTDTEPGTAAQRHGKPGVHAADAIDDLSASTDRGADHGDPEPDLVDDAADLVAASVDPGDAVPGDGSVGPGPEYGDADAMRTAAHGREEAAARDDTSDDTPTPTETHTG